MAPGQALGQAVAAVMHIRRALDQEIDRESIDYWFELRAAERASPEVELLKRRWEAKQRLTPAEVAQEHRRADLKHFKDRVEHDLAERYQRQLRDEGLHATPRYERVARHAEEVAADTRVLDAAGVRADDDAGGTQYAANVEQGPMAPARRSRRTGSRRSRHQPGYRPRPGRDCRPRPPPRAELPARSAGWRAGPRP